MAGVQHVESRDGTPVAFRASGAGEPIVLVHGSATTSADWAFVARELRERFTVVTVDRRGRGGSGDGPDYSMDREADDVHAVLDAVGAGRLVGHSYGALCCIRAAERRGSLARLVLYEPPIAIRAKWLDGLDDMVAAGALEPVLEGFLRGAGASEEHLRIIRSSNAWPVLLDAVPALPRELRAAAAWTHPTRPIHVPTLLLHGADTDGAAYLDGVDELASAFTDLRRESIPGHRHLAHVFGAADFANRVARFCAGEDVPAAPAAASR